MTYMFDKSPGDFKPWGLELYPPAQREAGDHDGLCAFLEPPNQMIRRTLDLFKQLLNYYRRKRGGQAQVDKKLDFLRKCSIAVKYFILLFSALSILFSAMSTADCWDS